MENKNPYVGLRNFKQQEGELFFGRDEQVHQLISRLKEWHFLSIIGDSGCGKSSLLRAGLLYKLEHSPDYQWKFVKTRPTFPEGDPFTNICKALKQSGINSDVCETLKRSGINSEDSLKYLKLIQEVLWDNPLPEKTKLLILVDQFEELFQYYDTNAEDAEQFVTLLLNLSQHYNIYIVIVMRADFLGKCAQFPNLPEAVSQSIFVVPRLTDEQLRQVIEMPARNFGGEIEQLLVSRLIDDMAGDPNRLPLLQHALMYMWERHHFKEDNSPHILTLQDYEEILEEAKKQIEGRSVKTATWNSCNHLALVLSHHANRLYHGLLRSEERKVAEVLFRNITEIDTMKHICVRRSIELQEIIEQVKTFLESEKEGGTDVVLRVVNTFRKTKRGFIIPTSQFITHTTNITISHESLISGWNLLHQWTTEEEKSADNYLRLRYRAENWKLQKKPSTSLSRGIQLRIWRDWWQEEKPTAAWAKRYDKDDGTKFRLAEEFLQASRAHELKQTAISYGSKVVGVLVLLLSILFYWDQQQRLQSESVRANEAQLAQAISDGLRENYQSVQQLLKDDAFSPNVTMPESYQHARKLLKQLNRISGGEPEKTESFSIPLNTVATDVEGRFLGIGGEQGVVILQNTRNNTQQFLKGHTDIVRAVAIDPQKQWIVTGGDDKQIIRWSLPEGKLIGTWNAPNTVWAMAISPDSKYIATGGEDNVVTLWATDTGKSVKEFTGHTGAISALTFDITGKRLISGSYDKTVHIWQIENGISQELVGHTHKVQRLVLSPDGQLLATSSSDRTIRLWDINSGQATKVFMGHQDTVFGMSFTADGYYLASGSADRTVRLWDVTSGVTVRVLQGHTAMVTDLVIQDKQIVTVSADRSEKHWEATLPYQHHVYLPGAAISTAIAPDGQKIAVGFADGMVRVYSLSDTHQLLWETTQEKHEKAVRRLAWSPNGQWLASASSDDTVKLWRATGGKPERTLSGHQNKVSAVTFSPDNRFLISTSYDGQMGVFQLGTTDFVLKNYLPSSKQELNSVVFNEAGTKLLIASDDAVHLFSFDKQSSHLTLSHSYPETGRSIVWAALSSDGERYVSMGRDGIAKVYATAGAGEPQNVLTGHQTTILRAVFSPDNHQLITVSGDATVRFWDLVGNRELFTLNLPTNSGKPEPLWDFDFRCVEQKGCFVAVPLTHGRLVWYELGKIY